MCELKQVQRDFTRYLLNGRPDITAHVAADAGGLDSATRLEVYANAYRARLHEALETDFPALAYALGDEGFTALGEAYIAAHPSPYFSLRDYGTRLPVWLADQPVAEAHPWLVELATLEWALAEAFDAPDADTAGVEDAAALAPADWPAMCLHFVPSLRVVTQTWDILTPWHAAKAGEPFDTVDALTAPTRCLVWREQLVTRFRSVAPDEAQALEQAAAGASFADLCTTLGETEPSPEQAALRAAALLKAWLEAGLVGRLYVSAPD